MKGAFSFKAFSAVLIVAVPMLLSESHELTNAPLQDETQKVNSFQDVMTGVAVISGQDKIALIHVHNLLALHGISAMSMGSLSYGVWVDNEEVERAKRILIEDATKNPYWLIVGDKRFEREAGSIKTVKLNLRINDDGGIKLCPRNPYIERAVRELYMYLKESAERYEAVVSKSDKNYYPPRKWDIAISIDLDKRRYLDSDGHWKVGYDFSVVLASSGSDGAFNQLRGNVWDEGKGCQIWGSGGLRRPPTGKEQSSSGVTE